MCDGTHHRQSEVWPPKADGSVITWGGADNGGDSSLVAENLRDGASPHQYA